jgi:FkbM family methyltransferase
MPDFLPSLFQSIEYHSRDTLTEETRFFAIYGAGNAGKDLFQALLLRDIAVQCFLDQRAKPGEHWRGVPIYPPDAQELLAGRPEDCCVLVAIFNRGVEIPPIVRNLRALGYGRIMNFLDVHAELANELGDRFWLTARSFYRDQQIQIEQCDALWADEESRDLYQAILKFRLTRDYGVLPSPDLHQQYFSASVPGWKTPLRFVDCGAYDGDTLQRASEKKTLEAVAAFECDPESYKKLAAYIRQNRRNLPTECFSWPCGVWSHTTLLPFSGAGLESSCFSPGTGITVSCVAIDQAIPFFRPTLIKMDVEGAEVEALWGARQIIQEYKPGLAICLYHRPEHLWQIPLLVHQWDCDYMFYLRSHGHSGFELVLYSV